LLVSLFYSMSLSQVILETTCGSTFCSNVTAVFNITFDQCMRECHPCQKTACTNVRYSTLGQTIIVTYYLPNDNTCSQASIGVSNVTCGVCAVTPTVLGTCPLCITLPPASLFTCDGPCSNPCSAGPATPPPSPPPTIFNGTMAPTIFGGTFIANTYCGNLNCNATPISLNFTFNKCAQLCNPCDTTQCTYVRPTLCNGIVTVDYYLPSDVTCSNNRVESQAAACGQCKAGDSVIGTCPFCINLGVYSAMAQGCNDDPDICQSSDTGLTYGGKIALIVSLTVGLFLLLLILLIIGGLLYYFFVYSKHERD